MRVLNLDKKEIELENDLISRSKDDPAQFKEIYEKYFKAIFLFIYRKTGDKDLTGDLVSQVFSNALGNIKKYEYRGLPFSAWLYRIADNEVAMYFRKNKKLRWVTIDDRMIENICEESRGPDPEIIKKHLDSIIQQLSLEEIQLLELRFYEDKSYKEIAFITNLTVTNLKTKVWRILEKIRKKMSNYETPE